MTSSRFGGVLLMMALLICGCSTAAKPQKDPALIQSVPASVTITIVSVAGLGQVLADADGHVLYMFPVDAGGHVRCTGPCAGTWPPLVIAADGRAKAGPGVNSSEISTTEDPNTGAQVVTFAAYPLYRYAGDVNPGTANGQALFLNGGPWYVMGPQGNPITTSLSGS